MGLLSNLLNDDSGKKAAGSVSDMEKALANDDWITIHPYGFLQGEGEDETKKYYRRIYIDDDGNIEKGIGKGHNIKDLSKVMKKEREGTEGKTPGKEKGASGLQTLQDKIKAIIDDGTPYNEEKAQKVGEILLQELENNQGFKDVIAISKAVKEARKEVNGFAAFRDDEACKKAYEDFINYSNKMRDKWAKGEIREYDPKNDPEYQKLSADFRRTEQTAAERHEKDVLNKYKIGHLVTDNELSEKTIEIVHESLGGVIDFDKDANPKDFTRSRDLQNTVQKSLSLFPKKFIEELQGSGVKIEKGNAKRSYFDPYVNKLKIVKGQEDIETITHELSHAIEDKNKNILKIEEEFYNRRTKGEPLQKLSTITGKKFYKPYEVARVDKFLSPYMGKDYSIIRGGVVIKKPAAYELLSMGTQYLVSQPEKLMQDRDYARFVLGCLAYREK